MKHAFVIESPAGKVCSICGVSERENDLVPRCESMPHPGRHWWAPGDGNEVLRGELVGSLDAARAAARALDATPPRQLRRALRAGGA